MARRILTALAVTVAMVASVAAQEREVRHSGSIVEIRDSGRTIVVEEMVEWQGADNPGIVRRSIAVTPDTSIRLVRPSDEWGAARTSLPGWTSESIDATDMREGDFVTVTTGARSRAVALQVIRPEARPRR